MKGPMDGPMRARDASEIARYLYLRGMDARLARVEDQADGSQLWRVPNWRGPDVSLRFYPGEVGADEPSQLLDPGDLHDFSIRAVQAVPTSPTLLGPGYLDQVLGYLIEAVAARTEIRRFLPSGAPGIPASAFHGANPPVGMFTRAELDRVDAMLRVLVDDMVAARRTAVPYPPEQLLFPQQSFRLPEGAQAAIPRPPCPVDELAPLMQAGWALVDDHLPNRPSVGVLRHEDGAILEVIVEDEQTLVNTRIIEGPEALWVWVNDGFRLTPEAREAFLIHLAPGRRFDEAIRAALDGIGVNVSGVARFDAGNGRFQRILLADQLAPRRRSAVLAVITDANDVIQGRHLLEGPAGFDQLARVLRRAALQQSGDTALQALARVDDVGDSARALLGRYLAPDADHAAITASILPRPGDAAKVFRADVAASVERAVRAWHANPAEAPRVAVQEHQTELRLDVATVADLKAGAPPARPFPKAYQALSEWLLPDRIWVTWTVSEPGEKGMRYDGLVLVDDHWAWFPKSWRLIEHA